jgi:phosphoglycolate phosphatase-like HAD superfamily hydrolase
MRTFDLVLFDFDGTLCHTHPAIAHCIKQSFSICGRTVPDTASIAAAVGSGLPLPETLVRLDENCDLIALP